MNEFESAQKVVNTLLSKAKKDSSLRWALMDILLEATDELVREEEQPHIWSNLYEEEGCISFFYKGQCRVSKTKGPNFTRTKITFEQISRGERFLPDRKPVKHRWKVVITDIEEE